MLDQLAALNGLHWAWPWMALMLPLPWLLRWLAPARPTPFALAATDLPEGMPDAAPGHVRPPLWAALSWIFLVVAAMNPQSAGEAVSIPAEGRDLMLAVDISGSMNEEDVVWDGRVRSRLMAVQSAAGEFLRGRDGDRIGLVLFGETAHLYTPLSLDTATAADMLREVEVGLAGQKTAIGSALAVAIEHLLDASDAEERVIVLLTDGENNAGEITPDHAADLAAQANIRIHTIGLDGERRSRRGLFDSLTRRGVDTDQLRRIAQRGGGQAFIARGGESLAEVYAQLDRIEPRAIAEELRLPPNYLYWLALLASAICALPFLRSLGTHRA